MSSATTRPDVNLSGLSDSPVGSMMVAVARWICEPEGKQKSSLFTTRLIAAAGYTQTFLSFSADFLHDLSDYLFRESELQQAALPQRRLEDLNQLHWFTGRQTGHQLQKLVHETVLEVGQLCQEQPEGAENRTEGECFYFCYEGSKWKQKPTKTPGVFWGFSLSASKIYNSCIAN